MTHESRKRAHYADQTRKPSVLPVHMDGIPIELRALPQWVAWGLRWTDAKKWDKPPIDVHNGRSAKSNDPSTWEAFDNVLAYHQHRRNNTDGVGFMFSKSDPYIGIDLDDSVNNVGELLPWAAEIIRDLDTYGEYSPSGTGCKLIVRGKLPTGCRNKGKYETGEIEVYEFGRYFTITGKRLVISRSDIRDGQQQLETFLSKVGFTKTKQQQAAKTSTPLILSDAEVLEKARTAKNGERFQRLWRGDTSDYQGDDSSADLALCSLLAFWTQGRKDDIDRLFRLSGLMRPKWDRDDYRSRTIDKVISERTEYYTPPLNGFASAANGHAATKNGNHKEPSISKDDVDGGRVPGKGDAYDQILKTPEPKFEWPEPLWLSELGDDDAVVNWIWQGCLALEHITLMSALMKCGKSTLLGHLLRCVANGLPFCGRATKVCRTLIVSEESKKIWCLRRDALGINPNMVSVMCRPLRARPNYAEWNDFVDHVGHCAEKRECDLVVIDTLSSFAPWKSENDSAEVTGTMTPLTRLTEAGRAVLGFHHLGKGDHGEGKAARGSTALAGAVDVLLEMRRYKPEDLSDRRRVLNGLGRFDEIPEEVVISLATDGSGYTAEGDRKAMAAAELTLAILDALPVGVPGWKVEDVHAVLEAGTRPSRGELGRILKHGGDSGKWRMAGTGKRGDPARFWRQEN